MKHCLWTLTAAGSFMLLGCGGEGGVSFEGPRGREATGADSESTSDSRDRGAAQAGPGGGGSPTGLLANCTGTFSCGGVQFTLSSLGGGCVLSGAEITVMLGPDGTATVDGLTFGSWNGDSSGFTICSDESSCTFCTPR
jgi:hypothetical protein